MQNRMEFIWPDQVFWVTLNANQFAYRQSRGRRWKKQPLTLVLLLKYLGHNQHLASLSCITQLLTDLLRVHDLADHFTCHCTAELCHIVPLQYAVILSHFRRIWELHRLPSKSQYSSTCKRSTHEHKVLVHRKS